MKTLNISKLSLAVAFTLFTAPALAQSSLLENFEGRIFAYADLVDNELNQKMLMTFEEHSQADSIAFSIDHTCGYVSGTLNLNDPASVSGGEVNIKLNKFGSPHGCNLEENDDLRTLRTANNIESDRGPLTTKVVLSSKGTGSQLKFLDVTKYVNKRHARQAILDSYWVHTDTDAEELGSAAVHTYLKGIQQLPRTGALVTHNRGLRIHESNRTDTGISTETFLGGSHKISNESVDLFANNSPGTKFSFDKRTDADEYDLTQGSIHIGKLNVPHKIFYPWAVLLQSQNRFQINGNSLTLTSDNASSNPIMFKRFTKVAKIEDLKNTNWVGSIGNEKITARFTSHSLDEMLLKLESKNFEAYLRPSAKNKSGSLDKAEVVIAPSGHAVTTALNNALPEMKLMVLDYSDANSRRLHIVTQNEIFSLTEKGASTPITFN
ncbi:hypothetical protein HC752_12890 [Vibrio sp. S9_S30]|uniref:hypothetical protein n=1 Tax=Vibrio sp. S9_S30 TaxID=2720226 RepID=UPI0016816372|nr:hypothetical protein [Vibrio sp. S9_S30]MBD1557830.1 hypothetical protein [Vibrio sp. S9_S30]